MSTAQPTCQQIQAMFCRVAGRYDFLNHLLSGGVDFWWREVLTQEVKRQAPDRLLDLATGSGDVLKALQSRGVARFYAGADFCLPMLEQAGTKGLSGLVGADGLALPFAGESFDAITISFGLRNWVDRLAGLQEMVRLLRPGGMVYVLEFSRPWSLIAPLYFAYLQHVLPRLAKLFGACVEDYHYLAKSIKAFPPQPELAQMMRRAGLEQVRWRNLTAGLVALHSGRKTLIREC